MDIIKIKCLGKKPNYYQKENIIYDPTCPWKKVGQAKIQDVLKIHPPENRQLLFYNTDKKVHKDIFNTINEIYSLSLIAPTNIKVHVKEWPERKDVTMSFYYNGRYYKYFSITDIKYEKKFLALKPGDYTLKDCSLLVVSLGALHIKDDSHYKLIATIIE